MTTALILAAFATHAHAEPLLAPEPKRCLPGPLFTHLQEDPDAVAYQGLSTTDVSRTMSSFLPATRRCFPEGIDVDGELEAWLEVGCDGLVTQVEVARSQNLTAPQEACIVDTLVLASFPAHDDPEGVTFGYTLRIDAPAGARP